MKSFMGNPTIQGIYAEPPSCGQKAPHSPSGEAVWRFVQGEGSLFPVIGWTAFRGSIIFPLFLLLQFGLRRSAICALASTIIDTGLVFTYIFVHKLRCR
jgi:hypothetical protein